MTAPQSYSNITYSYILVSNLRNKWFANVSGQKLWSFVYKKEQWSFLKFYFQMQLHPDFYLKESI